MKKIINNILISTIFTTLILFSQDINIDSDMDGVIDNLDECKNTPFLAQVNSKGCITSIILLPEDSKNDSWDIDINYAMNSDKDMLNRGKKYSVSVQTNYYTNNWIYSLRAGYYKDNQKTIIKDTTIKIKKRFKLKDDLNFYLGGAIKLPTYNYQGNNTDYTLYLSTTYYPIKNTSLFVGINYTFINDEPLIAPLQNTISYYMGGGYFYNKDLYINLSYTYTQSKFEDNEIDNAIMATVYYQITDKWFASITYSHELYEKGIDNSMNIHLGYNIW